MRFSDIERMREDGATLNDIAWAMEHEADEHADLVTTEREDDQDAERRELYPRHGRKSRR